MKKSSNWRKRALALGLSALLCVPALLSAMAGCSDGSEPTPPQDVAQATELDSAPISVTPIGEVTVTDEYQANALNLEHLYLLDLDADKLLYHFYVNAGLSPKASSGYGGGWESSLIGGHTMGHYLSALAQAYAHANTPETSKALLLERIEYIVDELKKCQDNAVAAGAREGFLWGALYLPSKPSPEFQFDNVEVLRANIGTEAWVPWYTMHKLVAGLIDVCRYTQSETALAVVKKLGDWVCGRTESWSAATRNNVLAIEYGGMNDCMYDLYALTGEERYAVSAHAFDEETLFTRAIAASGNYLVNLHANTTIPKFIGALNRYISLNGKTIGGEVVEASRYLTAAEQFWDYVVEHHSYVTGGNSEDEHFGSADILDGAGYSGRDNVNCETCNSYNMLKLSRMLFTVTGEKKYLDFYENTYINAILSSQNPVNGMTTYFQPMGTGYFKVYSSAFDNFWCCTGSGMESFSKLGDSFYYDAGNATYVALYASSTYETETLKLRQTADLEESDRVTIEVERGSTILRLRVPDWTTRFDVTVNGGKVITTGEEAYVSVSVGEGDSIVVELGKEIVAYNLPDAENLYAFKWGPFVLSAEYGAVDESKDKQVSHGVAVRKPARPNLGSIGTDEFTVSQGTVEEYIATINEHLTENGDGTFTLTGCDRQITYSVHYRQHTQRYGIYLYFFGEDVVAEDKDAYTFVEVDSIQPGYGQYETDVFHDMQDNGSQSSTADADVGGSSRYATAGGSFAYRIAVDKTAQNNYLIAQFSTYDAGKSIRIQTEGGVVIFDETLRYGGVNSAYTVEEGVYERMIPIPAAAVEEAVALSNGGETRQMVRIVISSGKAGENSARLHLSLRSGLVTFKEERKNANYTAENTSQTLLYFVNCGDWNVNTLSAGDKFGQYNSVTEQLYGIDAVTGRYWGLLDGSDPAYGSSGTAAANGISSANTWAFEQMDASAGDAASKITSNRYTKNQWETSNQEPRHLAYLFELEEGSYTVTYYLTDPWNVSKGVNVSANGSVLSQNTAVNSAVTKTVQVSGGSLLLEFSNASGLCINVAYITIARA